MRTVVLAKHQEDYTSEVEHWIRDFEHETKIEVEWLDPDTIEGEVFASSHDIMQFPTIIVVDNLNSSIMGIWPGRKLPQFEDVSYVVNSAI